MLENSNLADKECVPCKGGVIPLKGAELQKLVCQLVGWQVTRKHHLSKTYTFPNFVTALAFVNKIGELAERVGHHPDLSLAWGKVSVEIWTHKIDGLTENDFILASKIDTLLKE